MADNNAQAGGQLPPQPNVGAPGFDASQNGQGNPTHMPPPPLHIPPNTNPIPTAITSPDKGVMSPTSGGPFARRSAPEPNKRALYVGGLDPRVTEDVLRQIFETTGHVQNVKIIPDKNVCPFAPPNHLPSTIYHLSPSTFYLPSPILTVYIQPLLPPVGKASFPPILLDIPEIPCLQWTIPAN